MSDDWGAELTDRIGAEIKRLRGDRSGQWLSDRTEELGQRVSRSTISEIETRRRKSLSVDHLILLAAALDVAAVDLIYPGGPNTEIEILPGVVKTKLEAIEGFGGSKQLNDKLVQVLTKVSEAFKLSVEEIVELRKHIYGTQTQAAGDPTDVTIPEHVIGDGETTVAEVVQQIRAGTDGG